MLSQLRVGDLLTAIAEKTPAPASGAATALTGALAAALAELAARYAEDDVAAAQAHRLRDELLQLAEADAAAYAAFMTDPTTEARAEIVRVPEEIAAKAEEAASLATQLRGRLRPAVAADADVGIEIGRAAANAARGLAQLNRGGS